jgi:thiamine transporter
MKLPKLQTKTPELENQETLGKTNKNIFPTKILAEITVFVALAAALAYASHSFLSFAWLQGGSINLGMLPIFWLALRRGPKIGIFAGAVLGVVDLAIEPFVVHPVQFVLDYPLAFACLGLAGFFRGFSRVGPVMGEAVGGAGRFLCHFTSGVVYFANYAPAGVSPIVYSIVYNGTYMIPSIIICVIAIVLLQKSKTLNIYV